MAQQRKIGDSDKSISAVEWLIKQISEILGPLKTEAMTDLLLVDAIQKAKQMEKEQIKVSYGVGHNDGCAYMTNNKPDFEDQEQYYNETYNK